MSKLRSLGGHPISMSSQPGLELLLVVFAVAQEVVASAFQSSFQPSFQRSWLKYQSFCSCVFAGACEGTDDQLNKRSGLICWGLMAKGHSMKYSSSQGFAEWCRPCNRSSHTQHIEQHIENIIILLVIIKLYCYALGNWRQMLGFFPVGWREVPILVYLFIICSTKAKELWVSVIFTAGVPVPWSPGIV